MRQLLKIRVIPFISKTKGIMPQEFGKVRPLKLTHSPTMTP